MKIFAIINKSCQFVATNNLHTEDFFTNLFQKHQIDAEVFFISSSKINNLVEEILKKHKEKLLIIVGGGDGTISSVVNILATREIILGILPLGTLNHFAKDLNIPMDIEESLKVFKDGQTKKIDIAKVNDRYFINNASIGFYPRLVKERNKQMRSYKLGKFSAMFLSTINIFHRFPLYDIKLKVKGKSMELKTPLLFIGNNPYEISLFTFKSRQSLQQGNLCVYFINSKNRLQFLKILFFLLFGVLNQLRDFKDIFTDCFSLQGKRSKIQVGIDGELVSLDNPLTFKIQPKMLAVMVPKDN